MLGWGDRANVALEIPGLVLSSIIFKSKFCSVLRVVQECVTCWPGGCNPASQTDVSSKKTHIPRFDRWACLATDGAAGRPFGANYPGRTCRSGFVTGSCQPIYLQESDGSAAGIVPVPDTV